MEGQSVAADVPEPRQRKAPLTRQWSVGKRRGQMAKKLVGTLKLQVPAGKANPSPPVGPALGQHGFTSAIWQADNAAHHLVSMTGINT